MDHTFSGEQCLSPEQVFQRNIYLIDTVRKYRGVFVLLWHNTSFDESKYQKGSEVYEGILKYISKKKAYSGTVWDVIQEWEMNIKRFDDRRN